MQSRQGRDQRQSSEFLQQRLSRWPGDLHLVKPASPARILPRYRREMCNFPQRKCLGPALCLCFVRSCVFLPPGCFSACDVSQQDPKRLTLVTGSEDTTVRVWSLSEQSCTAVLKAHLSYVTSLAFLPGGAGVISGGRDRVLNVWALDRWVVHCVLLSWAECVVLLLVRSIGVARMVRKSGSKPSTAEAAASASAA